MRFLYASDRTLLVSFGEEIALETHHRLMAVLRALEANPVESVLNIQPAYCSLLIKFDPCRAAHEDIEKEVLSRVPDSPDVIRNRVEIPVCYGGEFGPDLADVAGLHGLSPEEVVALHAGATYSVYFLGFVPGFAYLGGLPPAIATPRIASPRKRVEPGSVGIAGKQSGVYPFPTPGGWRLLGRTPLRIFQANREDMSLLSIGDEVRFRPIGLAEYRSLEAAQS